MKKRGRRGSRLAGLAVLLVVLMTLAAGTAAGALYLRVDTAPSAETVAAVMPVVPMPERVIPPAADDSQDLAAPPEAPVEEVPVEEVPAFAPVAESEAVEDGYFADTVFLGDSRTGGLSLYSGLKEGTYLFSVGATVESVFTKNTQETPAGKVPLLDALADIDCKKVYIMLGINELGWPRAEVFRQQTVKVVERIRQDHPDTVVVLQSILPVSAKQEAKGSYVNNARIEEFNTMLKAVAEELDCPYLNVAEAVTGEDGCLQEAMSADGVHLNTAGCRAWLDYLKTHMV